MSSLISSKEIVDFLKNKNLYINDNNINNSCDSISGLANNSNSNSLCWIRKSNYDLTLLSSVIVIVTSDFKDISKNKTIVYTKNPQLAITYIINKFFTEKSINSISGESSIDKTTILGKNVHIASHVVIGKNCIIGENTSIYSNCVIYPNTIIGSNVIINAGSKIGQEGFGYIKDLDGNNIQFPHIGKVIIQDYVEIGSNTCIDRGALLDTEIGEHTKINNLVHVAHNVKIGKNCLITAQINIGGSVTIGGNVFIGPNSTIIDGISIGNGATIGMGSIVRKKVDSKTTIVPFASFEKREYIKILKNLRVK